MEISNNEFLNILSNMIQLLNYAQNLAQTSKDEMLIETSRKNEECLEEILNILKEKL